MIVFICNDYVTERCKNQLISKLKRDQRPGHAPQLTHTVCDGENATGKCPSQYNVVAILPAITLGS